MAYDARVLQILVASPGDVKDEREIVSNVIYEWNYVNSRDRSIVLLPMRWETHSSPELGSGPQTIINRQVIDHCDMAIAVFWTRLGTPTSNAASGTAEEITRMGNAGKPVMLYFSRAPVRLDDTDLDEYKRLTEFKRETYPKGLAENYESLSDFREKLRRQLALRISEIIAEDSARQSETIEKSGHGLALSVADGSRKPPALLSSENALEITDVICVNDGEIPDYDDYVPASSSVAGVNIVGTTFMSTPNRNYYREVVVYAKRLALRKRLLVALSGGSDESAQNIHLELVIRAQGGHISINPPDLSFPTAYARAGVSTGITQWLYSAGTSLAPVPLQMFVDQISDNAWRMEVDVPVVQAQRTVVVNGYFALTARKSAKIAVDATVYSSNSVPFKLSTEFDVNVNTAEMSYEEILKEMLADYGKEQAEPLNPPES